MNPTTDETPEIPTVQDNTLSYEDALKRQETEPYDGSYLVELSEHAREFVANGTRYIIRETMPTWRFLLLEQFGIEFGMTGGIAAIHSDLVAQRVALNKLLFSDVAVINNRLLVGFAKIDDKLNYAYQVCSLFISAEGEDLRKWDNELAAKKIDDWNEAGLAAGFFLRFAVRSVPGFIAAYSAVIQMTLPEE